MVDACCYVPHTGYARRLLPLSFVQWQAACKAFVRWIQAGAFERAQDRLHQQWRLRMGAAPDLSLRRSTPRQHGPRRKDETATSMQARRSRGASAAWRSIRSTCC